MVYEGFLYALKEEGIEEIEALNQPFDPLYITLFKPFLLRKGKKRPRGTSVSKGYKLKIEYYDQQWSSSHNKKTKLKTIL